VKSAGGKTPDWLEGKRAAVVVYSHYPSDPRPRRAAEALVERGMKVEVISLRQNKDEPTCQSFNGVGILRFPMTHWRGGKAAYLLQYGVFLAGALLVLGFRSLTRRYRLVHVHNMPDVLVFASLVPKLFGSKVILDLHDPMPELMMTIFGLKRESFAVRLLRFCERLSVGFANVVLTPNAAFQKLFQSRGCPAAKLHVVMNTPDEGIFPMQSLPPLAAAPERGNKPFVVMYHGALVERHGLDLAVQAVSRLQTSIPNIELRVYGRETPFVQRVMEDVRARGLESSVKYFGGKKLEEIALAIDQCDVGIIPNRRGLFTELNLPTRIFEYLARGKAVIAPRTPGIQDYFSEDDLVLMELGDAEDLARKLEYVFLHPEEVSQKTARGQAVYRDHRWSEERLRFLGIVRALLAGDRAPIPTDVLQPAKVAHPDH
jgi:glycosyltransferase involved in cell wall biosynthesis